MQNKALLSTLVGLAICLAGEVSALPVHLQIRAPPVIETISDFVRGGGLRHRVHSQHVNEPAAIYEEETRPLRGGYVPGTGKRRLKKIILYSTGLAAVGTATGVGAHEVVDHEREQNRELAKLRADLERQAAAMRESARTAREYHGAAHEPPQQNVPVPTLPAKYPGENASPHFGPPGGINELEHESGTQKQPIEPDSTIQGKAVPGPPTPQANSPTGDLHHPHEAELDEHGVEKVAPAPPSPKSNTSPPHELQTVGEGDDGTVGNRTGGPAPTTPSPTKESPHVP
ncbi:hypothetical protein IE81DRAFT_349538 [Ceraceosorus guamensis]|uniref:Uncharacterized protein n=1 Tax=Ceraceosorus guamensis TaxID=1522189 RepID=A0A316VSV2_9BASI|nr:hypothetical protein IE81DRAFT_349538 [Ceraceosorus guamensis]PWN40118.1 hypothetical protein IE81DRAFT_349538 [Ceraceosorus guamensis]